MTTQEPKLFLLSGKKSQDVESLAKFSEALTGRRPTRQELEEAEKILSE